MKLALFRHLASCRLVEINRHSRGAYWFHHQGDLMMEAVSISETLFFILAAVRNANLTEWL
jgi:hypothetical protein